MELAGVLDVSDPVHMSALRTIWMHAIDDDLQKWAKAWNMHRLSSKKKSRDDPRFVSGVPAKLLRSKASVAKRCVPSRVRARPPSLHCPPTCQTTLRCAR